MKVTAIVQKCAATGQYIGYIPGVPGAHSQGKSMDRLLQHLKEALELIQEDGPLNPESEFVGLQTLEV